MRHTATQPQQLGAIARGLGVFASELDAMSRPLRIDKNVRISDHLADRAFTEIDRMADVDAEMERSISLEYALQRKLSKAGRALFLEYTEVANDIEARKIEAAFALGVLWASRPDTFLLELEPVTTTGADTADGDADDQPRKGV